MYRQNTQTNFLTHTTHLLNRRTIYFLLEKCQKSDELATILKSCNIAIKPSDKLENYCR